MATPIWISGWEYGLASPVINGGGICAAVTGTGMSIQSTIKRTGSYALKGVGTSGEASITVGIPAAIQTDVFAFTFYFRWDTAPNREISIARIQTNAGSTARINFDPADNKIFGRYVSNGTKVNQVLAQSTWYRIDCKADVSTGTSKLWYNVDGVGEQYTEYTQAATTFNGFRLGFIESTPTISAGEAYWDDCVYSNTISDYPIGTVYVLGLRPNADGTHNNAANIMEDSAGNDIDGSTYFAYDKLDEDPWVSTAGSDYVRQTANGTGNYCEIQFADISQSNIMGVQAMLQYSSASTSSNTGACIIRSGTTETTLWGSPSSLADYSESSSYYKRCMVSPDGGSWTQTIVNAIRCRFGYSGDASPDVYWQAIMLEVAYAPSGTQYPQSVSGAVSPSGAMTIQTRRPLAGAMAASGVLSHTKSLLIGLTGLISPSGVLSHTKALLISLVGSIAPTGGLVNNLIYKLLSGAISPTSVLAGSKVVMVNLTGFVSPVGTIAIQTIRTLTGAISPVGDILKRISRPLAGLISPSGTLSSVKVVLIALAGAISPSGAISYARNIVVALNGLVNPSGVLSHTKALLISLVGSITPIGTIVKQTYRRLTGAINPAGALTYIRVVLVSLVGLIAPSGVLSYTKSLLVGLAGVLQPTGELYKRMNKAIGGAIAPVATLVSQLFSGGMTIAIKVLRLSMRRFDLRLDNRVKRLRLPPKIK